MDLLTLMPLPDRRARQSAAARRRWENPEYRAKQSAASKRSHSAEHMAKMRAAITPGAIEKKRQTLRHSLSRKISSANAWTPERRRKHAARLRQLHRQGKYRAYYANFGAAGAEFGRTIRCQHLDRDLNGRFLPKK
jgi:hypothetical protein